MTKNASEALDVLHGTDTQVAIIGSDTMGVLVKSEVDAQLNAAHAHPRNVRKFLDEAMTIATFDTEIAQSCIYAVPRAGKVISGPSVRLAEICASAYGNLHMGKRVIGAEDRDIVSQGAVWDLEKNNRITVEVRRRITDKMGRRFSDDLIVLTGNAAASIAFRNAVFTIIPKVYVNMIYERAREVSVGNATTLIDRRGKVIERLTKIGAVPDRILLRLGRASIEEITLDDLELLVGLGTAIKTGGTSIDEAFPAAAGPRPTTLDQIVDAKKPVVEMPKSESQELCDAEDWKDIEIVAQDAKCKMTKVITHIMGTMGIAPAERLPKTRKGEVVSWINAQRKPS